jgi:hypothetical protein
VFWKYTNRRAEGSEKQPGTDMDAASRAASALAMALLTLRLVRLIQLLPTRYGRTCRYQRHRRRLESTSADFIVRMFLPYFLGTVLFSDRTQQLKYACLRSSVIALNKYCMFPKRAPITLQDRGWEGI